uniref:Uncharacterized protein n=1 Tax=Meloidogyne enterolobii TaxID=390850 RepID=A0A6V7W063_MELEN|nr:unnamed protein product [Meloidogyne enterolobii]
MKQTNLHFRDFINNFEGELAREEFYEIDIDVDLMRGGSPKLIKPESKNVDFPLSEELEKKFKNGFKQTIPLCLDEQFSHLSYIFLTKDYNDEACYYQLQLPTIIKSKNDIKIVYFYLNKLIKCSFKRGMFQEFIFNPELIQLLFGNAKQFHIQKCKIYIDDDIGKIFGFILNNLVGEKLRINFFWRMIF